jgi:hypothetical protein
MDKGPELQTESGNISTRQGSRGYQSQARDPCQEVQANRQNISESMSVLPEMAMILKVNYARPGDITRASR